MPCVCAGFLRFYLTMQLSTGRERHLGEIALKSHGPPNRLKISSNIFDRPPDILVSLLRFHVPSFQSPEILLNLPPGVYGTPESKPISNDLALFRPQQKSSYYDDDGASRLQGFNPVYNGYLHDPFHVHQP